MGGLVASGKSTVARLLARDLHAQLLVADEVRADLHQHGRPEAFGPGMSTAVYAGLVERAGQALGTGGSVVLDATFRSRQLRADARRLARQRGVPFRFVECRCDPDVCRRRLRRREQESGVRGWLALFEHVLESWEPPDELPEGERVSLDTSGPPPLALDASVLRLTS